MPRLSLNARTITFLVLFASTMTIIAGTSSAQRQQDVVADASPPPDTIVIDTIGDLPTSTRFDLMGSMGSGINDRYNGGPRFTLTKPTTITEIGGYIATCCAHNRTNPELSEQTPLVYVNIHPQLNGQPDANTLIASYPLSDDKDEQMISYESVKMELTLQPGTYYAIFYNRARFGMIMWKARSPFEFRARYVPTGSISQNGQQICPGSAYIAVRILKRPN